MNKYALVALLLSLAVPLGCSKTVLVPVPPRIDLKTYGTVGIVQFSSNSDQAITSYATQQFQEHVQGAAPGTPILELGNREAVLAAVGAAQLDSDALAKIGKKYNVSAVFIGDLVYSEPKTEVRMTDIKKLDGGVRSEIRGDVSTKLIETRSGASVWSSSAWATRQFGSFSLSTRQGVNARLGDDNPRKEMVPTLMHHVTEDFRATYIRKRIE